MSGFPNKDTQFNTDNAAKMGAKGGHNKKGSKHLSTYIQEALVDPNFEIKLKDGSILREMPIKAILKTAIAKSISGDTRAMEWLAKHGYGEKIQIELSDPRKEILNKYMGESDVGKTQETAS